MAIVKVKQWSRFCNSDVPGSNVKTRDSCDAGSGEGGGVISAVGNKSNVVVIVAMCSDGGESGGDDVPTCLGVYKQHTLTHPAQLPFARPAPPFPPQGVHANRSHQ